MKSYLSLIKFSHTIFALPFALIGFSLGILHYPDAYSHYLLVLVLCCMVFARSAAMAFNRYLDQDIDLLNPRTAKREIPAGKLGKNEVLIFVIFSAVLFVVCTAFINKLCLLLSPIALFVVLGYSYTKRFTALCHFVLGLGLALAPVGAYLAVSGVFHIIPVLFGLVVLFWVAGFDIIYALQDVDFDKENQLNSTPALLGKEKALLVSSLSHGLSIIMLVAAGYLSSQSIPSLNILFWGGIVLFSCLIIYQHTIVKSNDLSRVNMAFFTLNGMASLIFGLIFIYDAFL